MDVPVPLRLATHFAPLHEPRVRGRCDHRLLDIVILALCGVIANSGPTHQTLPRLSSVRSTVSR